jgi:hypothetical protein
MVVSAPAGADTNRDARGLASLGDQNRRGREGRKSNGDDHAWKPSVAIGGLQIT